MGNIVLYVSTVYYKCEHYRIIISFQTGIVISNWLRPLNPKVAKSMDDDDEVETSEVKLYQVVKL